MPRRVLVVDDDDAVRRAVVRELSSERFSILEARTAVEALALLAHETVDAVVTDHDLGTQTTGADLLRAVSTEWPATARVLLSGRSLDALGGLGEADVFLQKPWAPGAVAAELTRVLDSSPRPRGTKPPPEG